jgi:hypothetical protein
MCGVGEDGAGRGSMSRSKIADDEECLQFRQVYGLDQAPSDTYTEVGEEGIEEGDLEPNLMVPVDSRADCFVEAL